MTTNRLAVKVQVLKANSLTYKTRIKKEMYMTQEHEHDNDIIQEPNTGVTQEPNTGIVQEPNTQIVDESEADDLQEPNTR